MDLFSSGNFVPEHFTFPRLEKLNVRYCNTVDLDQIAHSFPNLTDLVWRGCVKKECWEALGGLRRLEHLNVGVCPVLLPMHATHLKVADLSVFRNLKQLHTLILDNVEGGDTSPLADLKLLRVVNFLALEGFEVDLSGLRNHPRLSRLSLPDGTDCSPLFGPDGETTMPFITQIELWDKYWSLGMAPLEPPSP